MIVCIKAIQSMGLYCHIARPRQNFTIMLLDCMICLDMEYLEVLTEGLDRTVLVRGSGREVITIFS